MDHHHQLSLNFVVVIASKFCSLEIFNLLRTHVLIVYSNILETECHEFKFFVIRNQLKAFVLNHSLEFNLFYFIILNSVLYVHYFYVAV